MDLIKIKLTKYLIEHMQDFISGRVNSTRNQFKAMSGGAGRSQSKIKKQFSTGSN
jgi:hypothetical protein